MEKTSLKVLSGVEFLDKIEPIEVLRKRAAKYQSNSSSLVDLCIKFIATNLSNLQLHATVFSALDDSLLTRIRQECELENSITPENALAFFPNTYVGEFDLSKFPRGQTDSVPPILRNRAQNATELKSFDSELGKEACKPFANLMSVSIHGPLKSEQYSRKRRLSTVILQDKDVPQVCFLIVVLIAKEARDIKTATYSSNCTFQASQNGLQDFCELKVGIFDLIKM